MGCTLYEYALIIYVVVERLSTPKETPFSLPSILMKSRPHPHPHPPITQRKRLCFVSRIASKWGSVPGVLSTIIQSKLCIK